MSGTFTPPTQNGIRYRVYMTPRLSGSVYGSEIEVTPYIVDAGVNAIQRGIDSQDYEVGVYFYSDIQITGFNFNGYFNEDDSRSIFSYFRDLTKVRVVYENEDNDTIVFNGLINEAGTTLDALTDQITFKVLSRDSVIRSTQIQGGLITDGVSVKSAMYSILSQSAIQNVLGVSLANINPSVNFNIDIGTYFDGKPSQDSLNILLLASNSVMTIDSSMNVFIKSRGATTTTAILNLYGPFDIKRRQNIITVDSYNTGIQRLFTSVLATDSTGANHIKDNIAMANTYGFTQNSLDLPFISDNGTIDSILTTLLSEFSAPKIELMVEVSSSVALGIDLLDRVSIDWPLRIWPDSGKFMPVIGTSVIGATNTPLPNKSGSIAINPAMAFKVIEINQDPSTFTTQLKLRQVGNTLSDGWFSDPVSSIIGYAVIGVSPVGGAGSSDDMWNPSVIGAARLGSTILAS